jgi:hypothetical protein
LAHVVHDDDGGSTLGHASIPNRSICQRVRSSMDRTAVPACPIASDTASPPRDSDTRLRPVSMGCGSLYH